MLKYGGDGHSLVIHSRDEAVILAFGIEKPAFRIVVNTWGSLGAIGATTGVMPSMTLAPGGIGGAAVGDNITVHHLLNIKRLAYERAAPPSLASSLAPGVQPLSSAAAPAAPAGGAAQGAISAVEIEQIVRRVLRDLQTK